MKFAGRIGCVLALAFAISATAFIFDRVTYREGMIAYNENIQKWREVRRSRKDRVIRSVLFGCVLVGLSTALICRSRSRTAASK